MYNILRFSQRQATASPYTMLQKKNYICKHTIAFITKLFLENLCASCSTQLSTHIFYLKLNLRNCIDSRNIEGEAKHLQPQCLCKKMDMLVLRYRVYDEVSELDSFDAPKQQTQFNAIQCNTISFQQYSFNIIILRGHYTVVYYMFN